MWSVRNPEGGQMPQTFGSALDQADEARKNGDGVAPCPHCGRATLMVRVFGECPFEDCRWTRGAA